MKNIKYQHLALFQIFAFIPVFMYFLINKIDIQLPPPEYMMYDKSKQIVLLLFIVPFIWFIIQFFIINSLEHKITNLLPIFIGFLHIIASLLAFILGYLRLGGITFMLTMFKPVSLFDQFVSTILHDSDSFFRDFFLIGQLLFLINIIALFFKKTKQIDDSLLDNFEECEAH